MRPGRRSGGGRKGNGGGVKGGAGTGGRSHGGRRQYARHDVYAGGEEEEEEEEGLTSVDDRMRYEDAGANLEYKLPEKGDFLDEEIESDEAFNSEDERKYGETLDAISDRRGGGAGGKKKKKKKKKADTNKRQMTAAATAVADEGNLRIDMSEDMPKPGAEAAAALASAAAADNSLESPEYSSSSASSGDESGAEYMTLSEMLAAGAVDTEEGGGGDSHANVLAGGQEFGQSGLVGSSSSRSESEEEEEEEGGDHAGLLAGLDRLDRLPSARRRAGRERVEATAASEFNLRGATDQVGVQDLLASLDSGGDTGTPGDNSGLRKQLATLTKIGALKRPVGATERARITRTVAYQKTSQDLAKWIPAVKANREAETLSFPLHAESVKEDTSSAGLTAKFDARTPLELAVASVLESSAAVERHSKGLTESETLALKQLTPEEARKRRKQLAKMRMLESYYEAKCKRMKKIKSKKYRKVRKRQLKAQQAGLSAADLAAVDAEAAEAQLEKEERTRAEERMSLRHRNQGKWAKRMLARGQMDNAAKRAIGDQLQLDAELRRKATMSRGSDESMSESEDQEMGEGESQGQGTDDELLQLGDDIRKGPDASEADGDGQKGLHALKFMRRAAERKRAEALEQLEALQRELGDEGGESEAAAGESTSGRMSFGGKGLSSSQHRRTRAGQKNGEVEEEEGEEGPDPTEWGLPVPQAAAGGNGIGSGMDGPVTQSSTRVAAPVSVAGVGRKSGRAARVAAAVSGDALGDGLVLAPESESDISEAEEGAVYKGAAPLSNQVPVVPLGTPRVTRSTARASVKDGGSDGGRSSSSSSSSDRGTKAKIAEPVQEPVVVEMVEEDSGEVDKSSEKAEEVNPWMTIATDVGRSASVAVTGRSSRQERAMAKLQRSRTRAVSTAVVDQDAVAAKTRARIEGATASPAESTTYVADVVLEEAEIGGGDNRGVTKGGGGGGGGGGSSFRLGGDGSNEEQLELIKQAFAGDNVAEEEFAEEKEATDEAHAAKGKDKDLTLPGWGVWGGTGVANPLPARRVIKKGAPVAPRKDRKLKHVIINERRDKRLAERTVSRVPHPYTSWEQYERAMQAPVGREWNTDSGFRKLTQPSLTTKAGSIIKPMRVTKSVAVEGRKRAAVFAARKEKRSKKKRGAE